MFYANRSAVMALCGGVATFGLAQAALAVQVVIVTPASAALYPNVIYDVDYATAGKFSIGSTAGVVDTVISIGQPQKTNTGKCALQVAWYDYNGSMVGLSSFAVAGGETQEFTTSVNSGTPTEYPPFVENVFSNLTAPFEGHAEIRVQPSSCSNPKAMRVDAEIVTVTFNSAGQANPPSYKSIAVSAPTGVKGY